MASFPSRPAALAAWLSAVLLTWPVAAQQALQRHADVIVVDGRNDPVTGLAIGDFVVREDGVAREIISVAPAPPPATIVLLVDTSQAAEPAILELRRGLTGFVDALATADAEVRIGLRTFGERPTTVFDPTGPSVVRSGIERLFSRTGAGAYLLEAIVETARDLSGAGAVEPALVAFVVEAGPEFSNHDRLRVAAALREARATLWTVVLEARGGAPQATPEARERAAVLGDGTVESGGLNLPILTTQAIPPAFERLRVLFTSRHRIIYGRPDTLVPPERLDVTTRREGLRVLAPRWAQGR